MSSVIFKNTNFFDSSIILLNNQNKFEPKNTPFFSKQHTAELFECCCQKQTYCSQSIPTSTQQLSDSISARAFQVTAACYCVGHYTDHRTLHTETICSTQACDAGGQQEPTSCKQSTSVSRMRWHCRSHISRRVLDVWGTGPAAATLSPVLMMRLDRCRLCHFSRQDFTFSFFRL